MKAPYPLKSRLAVIAAFLGAVLLLFSFILYDTQIIHGSEYKARSTASNATDQVVEASRGVLTDRNGKVLVSNRLTYTLIFSADSFEDDVSLNAAIWRLLTLLQENQVSWRDTLPLSTTAPYTLTTEEFDERFVLFAEDAELPGSEKEEFSPELSAADLMELLCKKYGLSESYTPQQARLIAGVRYELDVADLLGSDCVLASDISVELISQVVDGRFAGVTTGTASTRFYNTPYAAHILGRIGPIYHEEWVSDEETGAVGYQDMGYSMNDLVGKDGAEKAFESYLHGTNGIKLVTTSDDGKITGEFYLSEPQPGNTVALTLDIDLQQATEESLARVIGAMEEKDGRSRGGAAVAIAVGSGEVLSLASYPTYDLSRFDELYDQLVSDTQRAPLFNRATDGTYAPGSTFKPLTAVAALESGIISPYTNILDRGIYDYYSSPQPMCWIFSQWNSTHGYVDVTEAITVSCNYFFYEVGRLTGIDTLESYARQFGFGQSTGIEIGDSAGALASPEYAEANDLEWTDGQTLTAAIGQSYNLFTPLQLANYMATLAGDGKHYQVHLLKNVKSYDNSSLIYVQDTEPLNTVEMSAATKKAVLEGMYDLAQGSLAYEFANCVVPAGAKTGTAEVGGGDVNGVFIAFAPYDDPQIAVAVAIEKAEAGADLAPVAVDILNAYFSRDEIGTVILGENALIQ